MGTIVGSVSTPTAPGIRPPTGLTRAGRNRAWAGIKSPTITIEVIGANVLAEHFQAVAWATLALSARVLQVCGIYQAEGAKMILSTDLNAAGRPHIVTGDLYRSVLSGINGQEHQVGWDGNDLWIDISAGGNLSGHGEARARFLEWGFRHVLSKKFIRYPYMMPALDVTQRVFEKAMIQIAYLPERFPQLTGALGHSHVAQPLMRVRPFLYSLSRALGDIQVFVGSPFVGRMRGYTLQAARSLGDLNAIMSGAIAQRGVTRFVGGGLAGIQSGIRMPTLTAPSQYSGMAGRVYNRYVGRGFGMGLRELT